MIKALLLLIRPVQTWDGIDRSARSIAYILLAHLLPLILLTSAAEGYGLMHWGKHHKGGGANVKYYELKEVVVIETVQSLLLVGMVLLSASAAKAFAGTFHRRQNYRHAFTAVAYGCAPLITMRLGDMLGTINPWIPWSLGMVLTIAVLYHGLPCILKPDPPHAFGLFLMTSLTLAFLNGMLRLVTWYYFTGRFPEAEKFIMN
jgi:uncharacterized membrane protein YecN with MAPEG domain